MQDDEWIPLEKAKELWENGAAVFLDAREAKDYAAGHIPNAFNLPVASFEAYFEEVAPILTPESLIVIYCDGIDCELSHRIKERLVELSFTHVKILFNGWTVWREAGLATGQGSGN